MKKTLSLFIASIFLVNSVALAAEYPCKAEYEKKLAELQQDYEATLARTFKTKGKVVGGLSLHEKDIYSLCTPGCDADLDKGNGWIVLGNLVGATIPGGLLGGLPGTGVGAGTEMLSGISAAEVSQGALLTGAGVGTVIGTLVMANWFLLDSNMDFKEITHFGSTMRFLNYIQLQAANDVLKEIYEGQDQLNAQYRQRTINLKEINDANDKRLAKINKRRSVQDLAPLKMEEAFLDFKIEEIEDSKIYSALDAINERVEDKLGGSFTKDELVQIIKNINEEKLFCEDGEPVKLKKMYKIIKGRIS